MHLIAAMPGGWNPDEEGGVFHIQQEPGDIVFLSSADTELYTMARAYHDLNERENNTLPSLRMANLVYFKQELTIDTYAEEVLEKSRLIVLRLLGGKNYYQYLYETVLRIAREKNIPVVMMPGYDRPDMELMESSTCSLEVTDALWKYFVAGGTENLQQAFVYMLRQFFGWGRSVKAPEAVPDLFFYDPGEGRISGHALQQKLDPEASNVAVIGYRSHYLAGNLEPVDTMITQLRQKGVNVLPLLVHTLRDREAVMEMEEMLTDSGNRQVSVVINTSSFAIKSNNEDEEGFIFDRLRAPVIQAVQASSTKEAWQEGFFGLTPTDIAMNVSLPEMDGRIITKAVSFKKMPERDSLTDSDLTCYEAHAPGCRFVTDFAENWINLQHKNNKDKRVALVLPNYPGKDSRLANGVGLDTPASAINVLQTLQSASFNTGGDLPADSDALMERLTTNITNEVDSRSLKKYEVFLPKKHFDKYYEQLSDDLKQKIESQWGKPEDDPYFTGDHFALSGFLLQGDDSEGAVWVSLQPSRGYNVDPQASYHSPDLPPTFAYLAFYFWMEYAFKADAVVHLGKHGNLEWLPGKSIALDDQSCFPAALFGSLPHFYPFIVNDPGEGAQAKRRNQAVILDHLIPPMTRAETYGTLTELENLIDEYYEAYNQDKRRAELIKDKIQKLVEASHLKNDLNCDTDDVDSLLMTLDGYLCEIKEAQIREGLHILGEAPENESLADLLVALHRVPGNGQEGLTRALANDLNLSIDPLDCEYSDAYGGNVEGVYCRTAGDVVERLEGIAKGQVQRLINQASLEAVPDYPQFKQVLSGMLDSTLPKVRQTGEELSRLTDGLEGRYIPSGPSGAPTRGRLDILPTGRNFYSVDVRTVPTEAAYELGKKSAESLVERYMQEEGDYPETVGVSVWGTATMRTGGDDIAQALALLGVKPVWRRQNRRVSDFEVVPLFKLDRPRVDVTLRISGFFRDAFPDIISLFNRAVETVAHLDEDPEENPVRKRYLQEKQGWQEQGVSEEQAEERSLFRVFGSKPGAYGAGLQGLIDEGQWQTSDDLARAYINWSGYAYVKNGQGRSAHEVYRKRLEQMEVVMQNQDNREHDILDSDDYYQFHGGMANAVKSEKGSYPQVYFGDHAKPENPRVKSLKEELLKVYRSRVVNPKWIESVRQHGYKGAFEMAATMDYLFSYDATTDTVDDFMYEGITEAYLMDEENRQFIEKHNPWALRDMSERMLEAIQRGMWKNPSEEMQEKLKELYLEGDELMEARS